MNRIRRVRDGTDYVVGGRDTNTTDRWDDRTDAAMRQFVALRRREGTNLLNGSTVGRMARKAGRNELAAIERRRYYELVERYRRRTDSTTRTGG